MEGLSNGSAAEEELGRLMECGKPRVPSAHAVREPWGPYVSSTWSRLGLMSPHVPSCLKPIYCLTLSV